MVTLLLLWSPVSRGHLHEEEVVTEQESHVWDLFCFVFFKDASTHCSLILFAAVRATSRVLACDLQPCHR